MIFDQQTHLLQNIPRAFSSNHHDNKSSYTLQQKLRPITIGISPKMRRYFVTDCTQAFRDRRIVGNGWIIAEEAGKRECSCWQQFKLCPDVTLHRRYVVELFHNSQW